MRSRRLFRPVPLSRHTRHDVSCLELRRAKRAVEALRGNGRKSPWRRYVKLVHHETGGKGGGWLGEEARQVDGSEVTVTGPARARNKKTPYRSSPRGGISQVGDAHVARETGDTRAIVEDPAFRVVGKDRSTTAWGRRTWMPFPCPSSEISSRRKRTLRCRRHLGPCVGGSRGSRAGRPPPRDGTNRCRQE